MKSHGFFTMASLLLASLSPSAASASTGGRGGEAHVCYEPGTKNIKSIEMYDLWEGRERYHLDIVKEVGDPQTIANKAIRRIFPESWAVEPVASRFTYLRKDLFLEKIPDATHRVKEKDCDELQIADYGDDGPEGEILINSDYYYHPTFTDTDRAALMVHETIYKMLRDVDNAEKSDRARRVVATLFSSSPVETATQGIPASGAVRCYTNLKPTKEQIRRTNAVKGKDREQYPMVEFFMFPISEKTTRFQFLTIEGRMLLGKEYLDLPRKFIENPMAWGSVFYSAGKTSATDGGTRVDVVNRVEGPMALRFSDWESKWGQFTTAIVSCFPSTP
jgi:hypothetical protein